MAKKKGVLVVKGTHQVMKNLKKLAASNTTIVGQAIYTEAELIMTASKRIVPVDDNPLRSSGHVEQPTHKANTFTVEMGYNTEYAMFQHEDLHWDRKKGRAVSMKLKHQGRGQSKYLEKPLMAVKDTIGKKVANRIYRGWVKANLSSK